MNDFALLTTRERDELSAARVTGVGILSLPDQRKDAFSISLSTGRIVRGKYLWDSKMGEFEELDIIEGWD